MKQKKSQMEIMGLAIIVVLLILGMLFAVKFILFKPATTYRGEYTQTQLAANILNSILNTNTGCFQISVSELLQDASKYPNNNIKDCEEGYPNSRDYVTKTIGDILNQTLTEWKITYYFKAEVPTQTVVEIGTKYTNRETEAKQQPLTTDVGTMIITLNLYR